MSHRISLRLAFSFYLFIFLLSNIFHALFIFCYCEHILLFEIELSCARILLKLYFCGIFSIFVYVFKKRKEGRRESEEVNDFVKSFNQHEERQLDVFDVLQLISSLT